MPNPSPNCVAQDGSGAFVATTPTGLNVTPGNTITVKLASYAGVSSWSLTIYGLDELSSPPALTYTPGATPSYSFTFPNAVGRAVGFSSVVNGGVDANGVHQASYSGTFGLFTTTALSLRVLFTNETFEGNAAGWIADFNAITRLGGGGAGADANSIRTVPVDATASSPGVTGATLRYDSIANEWFAVKLSLDDLAPAFTPTLPFHAGGTGPVEVGQTGIAPTFDPNPAGNSGSGLTVLTIGDNQGGTTVSRFGSGNPVQGPNTTYTAPSTPGTMTWTGTWTKSGVTKTATASIAADQRYFAGVDPASDGSTATASGGNATLGGGGATQTLTGALAAAMIGTTFTYTISSGSKWVYALYPHTASPGTFVDNVTTFGFSMSVVATFSFTNQYGVAASYDLYRSDFVQTVGRTVRRNG